MARHKYGIEKRQRELNKERKKAEKQQRKLDRMSAGEGDLDPAETQSPGETPEPTEPDR